MTTWGSGGTYTLRPDASNNKAYLGLPYGWVGRGAGGAHAAEGRAASQNADAVMLTSAFAQAFRNSFSVAAALAASPFARRDCASP